MDNDEFKPQNRMFPMQGVEMWKNPRNDFMVMEIHYTADPAKRDPEWKRKASASIPRREWLREYEISWETWEGLPVYADWDTKIHGVPRSISPHIGLPLLRGWDFGLTPACVVAQVQEETLCGMKEYIGFNIGADRFSEIVLQSCKQLWPVWGDKERDWLDFIDPSGFAKKDTDEKSCADVLKGKGLRLTAGAIAFTKRKEAVEHFLTKRNRNRYGLEVSLVDCPTLVRGFKGGYMYPEHSADMEAGELKPVKNEFSHVHDAFQMIASSIHTVRRRGATVRVPTPGFATTRIRG